MSFTEEQKKLLNQKINPSNVSYRPGGGGQKLAYLESWHVIQEANRIFGFDGWSSETIYTLCVSDTNPITYIAKVKITVGDIVKEGTGAGHGRMGSIGEKHELAIKEAESDARKRALMQFGDQFGLSLYDKDKAWLKEEKETKTKDVSDKPIDLTEGEKFIKECEAFIKRPGSKDKLGLLKKNISKRFESKAITENQRDGLLTLILEKEDS